MKIKRWGTMTKGKGTMTKGKGTMTKQRRWVWSDERPSVAVQGIGHWAHVISRAWSKWMDGPEPDMV